METSKLQKYVEDYIEDNFTYCSQIVPQSDCFRELCEDFELENIIKAKYIFIDGILFVRKDGK